MTEIIVDLGSRKVGISFSHPWIITKFRGVDQVPVKTTTCTVYEPKDCKDERGRPRVRFISFARIKWPLVAHLDESGKIDRTATFSTLPGVMLSKFAARKLALKDALRGGETSGSNWKFTREEREKIWEAVLNFSSRPPVAPPTPQAMQVEAPKDLVIKSPDREVTHVGGAGGHKVANVLVFPQRLKIAPDAFFTQSLSPTVH